jgi:predicted ATPase
VADLTADQLVGQVRDALRHLYDPVYLDTHPLARFVAHDGGASARESAGAALRRCLLDAIGALEPQGGPGAQPAAGRGHDRAARRHRLLVLRYVDANDIPAVCAQLAISRREYEREHREGLDAVASLLQHRWAPAEPSAAPEATDGATLNAPASRPAPSQLPVPLTSFVGRQREVAEVVRLLRPGRPGARLVTLTGPAGVGKTRLALQAAAQLRSSYADGAVFAPLATVGDATLVLPAIARALGVREPTAAPLAQGVHDRLRRREVLIVLDNFEHLVGAAPALADLLAASATVKVLATSRAALRITGEQELPVAPLTLPRVVPTPPLEAPTTVDAVAQSEAVQLFVDRARAITPHFALTPESAADVAGICRRLDGLPLAIELAAARVRSISPSALLARLESAAGGLPLLSGAPRDAPARHQTLQAAIEWSYDLLAPEQQALFRRLAVFAGSFTLDAATAVAGEVGPPAGGGRSPDPDDLVVLRWLDELLAQSLLRRQDEGGSEPRYTMLKTVHEYALGRLEASGEADAARQRHASFYLGLATIPEAEQTVWWFDAVGREHENLRAAMRGCMAHDGHELAEQGLLLGVALGHLWELRGHWSQGRKELDWLLAQPQPPKPSAPYSWARATCFTKAGHLAWRQGDYGAAQTLYEAGLELRRSTGQRAMIAFSLHSLGELAFEQGDYAAARACHEEARDLRRVWGHRHLCATLSHLGRVLQEQGDDAAALALHEEALALARHYGVAHLLAIVLNDLGRYAWLHADGPAGLPAAHNLHTEALAIARELGDRRETAAALDHLGRVAHAQGDPAMAGQRYAEALAVAWEFGDRLRIAWCFEGLAAVAATQGQGNRAARYFGAAAALRRALGAPLPPTQRPWHARHVAAARAALGGEVFAAAWDKGQATPLAQAVTTALDTARGEPRRRGDAGRRVIRPGRG